MYYIRLKSIEERRICQMSDQLKEGCAPEKCGTRPECSGCSKSPSKPEVLRHPQIRKTIGVVSGKGGVGKSLVSGLLAASFARQGKRSAVLDADITGPSIAHMFGVREKAMGDGEKIYPAVTPEGIQLMSINMLLEKDEDPVIWRGPVLAGVIKQFWEDVAWENVDTMVIDMPPGTGDVPLTVFQTLPLDGIVIVATPQDLVGMVVNKAVNMAQMMNIPILGIIENMSYVICPDCGRCIDVFGTASYKRMHSDELPVLAEVPINPSFAQQCDAGKAASIKSSEIDKAAKELIRSLSL